MADKSLSDMEVYDLIHEARSLLLNKTVKTQTAQDALSMAIRDLAIIQAALLSLSEGVKLDQSGLAP